MAQTHTRPTALLSALVSLAPTLAMADVNACDASRWIDATREFCVALPPEAPRSGLRVYLGQADVSLWFRVTESGQLTFVPGAIPLPSGERDLIVRAPSAEGWREVMRQPLKILTRGFEKRTRHAALNLSVDAQPDSGASGGSSVERRGRFTDVGMQAALGFERARAGVLWRFDSELVGSSYRNSSLRHAELGARAPRVDLGQFQLAFARDGIEALAGHVSAGRHPLLLQNFDSRGLSWRQKLGNAVDISFASVNGSTIVGYDNLLGLADSGHRIDTITAGVELLRKRPGALRLEVSWLDGSVRSIDDFNAGEVSDSERSHGIGARLISSFWNGRLRSDLAFARSRYVNPRDELLAQGSDVVEVRPEVARAAYLDVRWEALRSAADVNGVNVVMHSRYERTDPLFRSVAATLRADYEQGQFGIDATWGAFAVNLATQRQVDNLDEIPTILRTRTTMHSLAGSVDLSAASGERAIASRWPSLTFRFLRQEQVAQNAPTSFQPTHLPNQANREATAGLRWATPRWEWTIELANIEQDNRQQGRELADYDNLAQRVSMRFAPNDQFDVTVGANRVRNHSFEQQRSDYTHAGWLSLQWAINRRWRFSGQYSLGHDFDSRDLGSERTATLQSELTAQYDLRQFAAVLPLQVFLRHSLTRGAMLDRVFALETRTREWHIAAGFNINFR